MGKKKVILILIFLSLLLPFILASSVDSEINRLTHYAEQYETGNIDYVQLLLYMSSVRSELNEILGAVDIQGGLLKQEQLIAALGEPQEETRWVWVEKEQREKRLDNYVPIWKKLVFDGKKIQITISAYPSLFGDELIYRLHFESEFKKPKEDLDMSSKIFEIKLLAEQFSENPTISNGDILAKASVNAERTFEAYSRRNPGQCIDVMNSIFGSENKRGDQKMLVQEIDFYSGDNFEVKTRLEMCDDCEWNWIGLNFWVERRGEFYEREAKNSEMISPDRYENLDFEGFKAMINNLLNQYLLAAENKDFREMSSIQMEIQTVNEAWNKKANEVWEEVEATFESKRESMSEEEQHEFYENYGWIKEEQDRRQREKEIRMENYEKRKQFYLDLFKDYYKKEFYFEQTEFEKRLIELFRESGKEICNNNIDDNQNEQIDCVEDQCAGKICGEGEVIIIDGNETRTEVRNLYCISGTCQAKEEDTTPPEIVCGNNICESGEQETCAEDCVVCPEHTPVECNGKVIFKGKDENNCPLEPVCVEEVETCVSDEDCPQHLCGEAKCMRMEPGDDVGICRVTELLECREKECTDGEERIVNCGNQDLIVKICEEGMWRKTGVECELVGDEIEEVEVQEVTANECVVKDDCGGENDVCSNGNCVTIPEIIEVEEQESPEVEEQQEPEAEETNEEESPLTGGVIFDFFRAFTNRVTMPLVTAEEPPVDEPLVEETSSVEASLEQSSEPPSDEGCPDAGSPPDVEENCWHKEIYDNQGCVSGYDVECGEWEGGVAGGEGEEWEDKERKEGDYEGEDMSQNCKNRCERECYDMEVRPCVDTCIRDECGDSFECDANKVAGVCESRCESETDTAECEAECKPKCEAGEETWKEPEWEHQEWKGVFAVGGACRTSQGETGGHMWFNGWGEPFNQLESLKQKYWEQGEEDWCKSDLENLERQRKEFEKGFNQEFVVWFFEDYLANSAEDWEQHVSGIYELYWNNVDNIMQTAHRMQCLGNNEMTDYNLINVGYETEYGSLEFWEEVKTVDMPGLKGKITVVTPYMKIWIFPSKEFLKYELKQSMINHEFPGPPEEKAEREREEGLTEEEKEKIKQNEAFMRAIKKIAGNYGGNLHLAVEFKDYETNEIVFNLYIQINEEDIFTLEPMLPEEVPEKDVTVILDFDKLYDLIHSQEEEMRGKELESPPWDRQARREGVGQMTDGIKMYLKIRKIINSAEVIPESSEKDVKEISKLFFKMMRQGMDKDRGEDFKGEEEEFEEEGEIFEERSITGKIIERW